MYFIHPPEFVLPSFTNSFHSYPIKQIDLGYTLNHFFQEIKAPETILLFSGTSFSNHELPQQPYAVSGNQDILILKQPAHQLPAFPGSHLIPFQEAIFAAWLSSLPDEITVIPYQLKTIRKYSSTDTAKRQFSAKFPIKQTQNSLSITVLIANYNHADTIHTAISSCLSGSILPQQIVIVDDASTDDSHDQLSKWQHQKKIQLIYLKKNGGKARALNMILSQVHTDYVIELDPDDWLDPNAFSEIANAILSWPKESPLLYGNLRKWSDQSAHQLFYKGLAKGRKIETTGELLKYKHPLGPRIYRTQSLSSIGGFPEIEYEEGRLYEDVAVLYKLLKIGPLTYTDRTFYNVRNHKNSVTQKNHTKWNGFLEFIKNWA